MNAYDLIVIGGGPAGYEAALFAADHGMRTALIEKDLIGGTCLNRGCIPTKTWLHSAGIYAAVKNGKVPGVSAPDISMDGRTLLEHSQAVIRQLRDGVTCLLIKKKVEIITGNASIPGPHQVRVKKISPDSEILLDTRFILIAAGSEPVHLPVPGCDLPEVFTSDDLFMQDTVNDTLTVIGGGVIGVEMAFLCSELGSRVSILEYTDRILPGFDREISRSVKMLLTKNGIEIHTSAQVTGIRRKGSEEDQADGHTGDELICTYSDSTGEHTLTSRRVLMAAGRRAATDGLFTGETQSDTGKDQWPPAMQKGRLIIDENGRTTMEDIYAAGDAADGITMLAHAASASAINAVCHMLNLTPVYNMHLVPSCIYIQPETASVGLTEREAKDKGISVISGKYPMSANAKSVLSGSGHGWIRVIADAGNHKILGASMMCDRASDMIGEFALAIENGLTLEQMRSVIRPHPTFEEAVGGTVRAAAEKS